MKSNGLHHAISLGNIEVSTKGPKPHIEARSYDSEDENMNRQKLRIYKANRYQPKPSVYSKGDIREQYCLTDQQLNTIERPRREKFFGCFSSKSTPQSFLGTCVGRRAPSDENLAEFAPFYRYPRYHQQQRDLLSYDDDLESSYFRRRPATILNSGSSSGWLASDDDDYYRIKRPRGMDAHYKSAYIVGDYANERSYLSQSSEQIPGLYQYPGHVGIPPPPLPPMMPLESMTPRPKHVSFARSHTLTSFDEAGLRSSLRLKNAESQERLIGGSSCYKAVIMAAPMTHHQHPRPVHMPHQIIQHQQQSKSPTYPALILQQRPSVAVGGYVMHEAQLPPMTQLPPPLHVPKEVVVVEKIKRGNMKTQATQTEVYLSAGKKALAHNLSLSPRAVQRVKVVSQGAQTNGIANGRKLTKSLSEMMGERQVPVQGSKSPMDHENLHRTQSEEPPRSPLMIPNTMFLPEPSLSRPSSCASENLSGFMCDRKYSRDYSPYNSMMQSTTTVATTTTPSSIPADYESNSLPRRTCKLHRPEPDFRYSFSLPRKDARPHSEACRHITDCTELLKEDPAPSIQRRAVERRMQSSAERVIRRQSMPLYALHSVDDDSGEKEEPKVEEEQKKDKEEKEIFIDFKPYQSASPNLRLMKKLKKTLSDGEILLEKQRQADSRESVLVASASEEDLKPTTPLEESNDYLYQNLPIKDEGIFDQQPKLYSPPDIINTKQKRDAFRKRSISLDNNDSAEIRLPKSAPLSPCLDDASTRATSAYPSSDSLTRDQSDGIWNESQVTVLTAETLRTDPQPNLLALTPSSRRKNLLLQHQQRSSIDTDALDLEEQYAQDAMVSCPTLSNKPVTTQKQQQIQQPPIIAVTMTSVDSESTETVEEEKAHQALITRRMSQDRRKVEPLIHSPSPLRSIDTDQPAAHSFSSMKRNDSGQKSADLSECSTNTEDYMTCTDTSKRNPGMRTPSTTASSSSTQVPVSAQSSQTEKTQNGSSFESASSLYSTRGDGLSEDMPSKEESSLVHADADQLQFPAVASAKSISPSHSVSSTSSSSYNLLATAKTTPVVESKPIPTTVQTEILKKKTKCESVSDDERSDKRYSSSGYYDSPHDQANYRRNRLEDERRKRKNNMKLDIERENLRALTSPIKKPAAPFNHISPDDRTALNTLDGASPSKIKRFRPKIRRQLRKTSRDDLVVQRKVVPKAAEKTPARCNTNSVSPMQPEPEYDEKRLKAKSIESLRSVSPGSDSVFYSEADASADKQVHCLHCGKEVEIVTALAGSHESIPAIDDEVMPDIVKPPADFADSPVTTKTSQRLYKKMDKRFRSEERDRGRHYRNRQETARAKSEERTKETSTKSFPKIRPADSSPCVLPDDFGGSENEKEPVVYRGSYSEAVYTRLTDSDVWIQLDHKSFDRHRDRRGSTDSEKTFHSKFQVILHRLVQRRCTLEMYHRQKSNTFKLMSSNSSSESLRRKLEDIFKLMLLVWAREGQALKTVTGKDNEVDKTVVVKSDSGEFGFRIHGSKPVVVAAIEPDTPAESSGLEVGDIIIAVNGVPVLDKHHTEVVKIAHAGCETLQLEVARTIAVLMNEQQEADCPALHTGYLWRQSGQAKGSPNSKKWVRRWFCLRPDHCLYYYKTDSEIQPVGATILTNHTVTRCNDAGRPHGFKIDSGEGIPMFLAADSEELATQWISLISHASKQADPWLELSSRNLRLPPNGIQRPDCFGYLMKLGSRWRGWSKRYCVLKDACLYFYQDANSKTAFGMACLQGYKVVAMSSNAAGRKNAFEIVPPSPKHRHYYFSVESDMDKKRWISALEYSIDRWIKAG